MKEYSSKNWLSTDLKKIYNNYRRVVRFATLCGKGSVFAVSLQSYRRKSITITSLQLTPKLSALPITGGKKKIVNLHAKSYDVDMLGSSMMPRLQKMKDQT